MFPTDQKMRQLLLDAYHPDNFYYYETALKEPSGFIDGLAWNSLALRAAMRVNDTELITKITGYVSNIINVGPDARNYAPLSWFPQGAPDGWVPSLTIPGYIYKKKPQSHAGPLAYWYAIDNEAGLPRDEVLIKKAQISMQLTKLGFVFGVMVRYVSGLRQHIDTMFLAYLAKGTKPAMTMTWMAKDNPFFSYICKQKCETEYPPLAMHKNGHSEDSKDFVPLKDRKPCTWIFRIYPYRKYVGDGEMDVAYTPIWRVTADYLQSSL